MAQAFTVLFVDDDNLVRPAIAGVLKWRDLRVLTASSAVEAMRILGQEHVDVLFTDVVMPDCDGIELAKQAKQLRPHLEVIFATAYFSRAADAAQLGKVLFKPLRAHQIEDAIDEVLRGLG